MGVGVFTEEAHHLSSATFRVSKKKLNVKVDGNVNSTQFALQDFCFEFCQLLSVRIFVKVRNDENSAFYLLLKIFK